MSITTEFYTCPEVPLTVRDFWSRRAAEQDPALALVTSPEWYEMMTSRTPNAVVVAAHRSDRPVGVLPCQVIPWSLAFSIGGRVVSRRNLNVARVWGGDLIEDNLANNEFEDVCVQIFGRYPDWDAVLLEHVGRNRRRDLIRSATESSSGVRSHLVSAERPHYRLALPETYEEFRRIRSSKSLSKVFGRERAMERKHGAKSELVELRKQSDWGPYAERIEELMSDAWQAHALGHTFSVSDMTMVADRGWNRSFMLTLGGQPIAFAFCYQGMGTLTYAQIGYDASLGRYSPGATLLYRLIEHVYESDPPAYLDFGEGEGDYKKQLANDIVHTVSLLLTRRSAGMTALLGTHRFVVRLDSELRNLVRKTALGRRLKRSRRSAGQPHV